jgi:hypothetical protein
MKTKLLSVLGAASLLAGCVVDSEQPFFRAGDVFFDERLVGEWREPTKPGETPGEAIRIERAGANGYVARHKDAEGKEQRIELTLFKLGGQMFVDYREPSEGGAPVRHQLMRVDELGGTWKFRGVNYRWVRDHLRAHPEALPHRFDSAKDKDNPPVTLTATTTQLQAFVLKHQAEPEFFSEPSVLERVKPTPAPKAR